MCFIILNCAHPFLRIGLLVYFPLTKFERRRKDAPQNVEIPKKTVPGSLLHYTCTAVLEFLLERRDSLTVIHQCVTNERERPLITCIQSL